MKHCRVSCPEDYDKNYLQITPRRPPGGASDHSDGARSFGNQARCFTLLHETKGLFFSLFSK
ncbi:hypothetical protein E2C01_086552 [Portunus trituberculatus]|uniref:Uncharacterized protein n=1 Tax=Portunus trituberculatus TaxID=210409 RepID=A0A5B7J151_PORTR|nr:hypothetical protein [Portunus trituberculatus]